MMAEVTTSGNTVSCRSRPGLGNHSTTSMGRLEFVKQLRRLFEIGDVETFGEPAKDGREEVASFGMAALVAAQAGKAHCGAQFPELGPLPLGDSQGFAIKFLGSLGMALPQQQLAFLPVQFRCKPALPCPFDDLQGIVQ